MAATPIIVLAISHAKALLKRAARAFSPREAVARARCVVAEAEIALASRDLCWAPKVLGATQSILEEHGDWVNAAHVRHIEVRCLLLIGCMDEAKTPSRSWIQHCCRRRGAPLMSWRSRGLRCGAFGPRSHATLSRAHRAAKKARVPALVAEVESAWLALRTPAARLIARGDERPLLLEEMQDLLTSNALIVDACRYAVRQRKTVKSLTGRPVLFTLTRVLAEAWPNDVSRCDLLARTFQTKHVDEAHRARLHVEIGRLRRALQPLAEVTATDHGFVLSSRSTRKTVVLARPVEEKHATVLAFLADGELWSSSALALALGASQRTVQRAGAALHHADAAGFHDDIVNPCTVARRLGFKDI